MQDTLHNLIGSNESIDDVEAIENGSSKVDKENTVQKNEILFRIICSLSSPKENTVC